jgi:hypothetical protein
MPKTPDATTGSHENRAHQGVCPHCGYCPTCGRSNLQPYRPAPYPVYPYPVVPWQPYRPMPIWIAPPPTWTNVTAAPNLGNVQVYSAVTSSPALAD